MSNSSSSSPMPQLAPPGAGLPKLEQWIASIGVRWQAARVTRAASTATFASEANAIRVLVEQQSPAALAVPVLIKRLRGLEDSSRYWSVLMTIDHLRIVNDQVADVIRSLAAGRVPDRKASTAAVKPSREVDHAVIAAFAKGSSEFERVVAECATLKTTVRFAHPWFGPLDAAGWHFMAGFHMRLHRKQMLRILAGLP